MRRLIVCLIVLAFSFGSVTPSLFAVEKKTKAKTSVKKQAKTSKKVTKGKRAVRKSAVKSAPKRGSLKKYDQFIDRNRNGIDDRRENLKNKTKGKKPTPKKKNSKSSKAKKKKTTKDK